MSYRTKQATSWPDFTADCAAAGGTKADESERAFGDVSSTRYPTEMRYVAIDYLPILGCSGKQRRVTDLADWQ
ncbi:hypothetical protein [Mycolicibacterium mucogenicum]|nr:hypothetical protein [Mycolicibacterium mucogenicum]